MPLRTAATLMFVAAAAGGALYLAGRPTVASGEVMAADMMKMLSSHGITDVHCDKDIPIGKTGAVFTCDVAASDGSTAKIEYTMDREGRLSAKSLASTGPTQDDRAPRVPSTGDPWGN